MNILLGLGIGMAVLLAAGCASDQAVRLPEDGDAARRQVQYAAQRTRAEAATLRAEVATARIAMAKKDAELKELRRQVADLTQTEIQRQQTADAKLAEMMSLRTERDRLAQEKIAAQVQLAELPQLRQAAAEAGATQGRLKGLESALTVLTGELAQVKKTLTRNQPAAKAGKATASGATVQPALMEAGPEPARAPGAFTVQPGDSLWMLARHYGLTVDELKRANGLDSDVIQPGQRLLIPK